MPRYIDADFLLKEISFYANRPTKSAMSLIKEIALRPADVVERKKGKWEMVWNSFFHVEVPTCSQCRTVSPFEKTNFCPNCGADMREEKEDV